MGGRKRDDPKNQHRLNGGTSSKNLRADKREKRREAKRCIQRVGDNGKHAAESFFCPITLDITTGRQGRAIGKDSCQKTCKLRGTNQMFCTEKFQCKSPWRICSVCVETMNGVPPSEDVIVMDSDSGLCQFHFEFGKDAVRSLNKEKEEASLPVLVPPSSVITVTSPAPLPPRAIVPIRQKPIEDGKILIIPRKRIRPFKDQPRWYFDEQALHELAVSIQTIGQQTPVIVREIKDDPLHDFELIDGQRRWLACEIAGIPTLRAEIRTVQGVEEQFELSAVANFCRQGHTELEEAHAIKRMQEHGRSIAEVSNLLGRSQTWVYQRLSLLKLSEPVTQLMDPSRPHRSRLKAFVALQLSSLPFPLQEELATEVTERQMKTAHAISFIRRKAETEGIRSGVAIHPRTPREDFRILRNFLKRVIEQGEIIQNWSNEKVSGVFEHRSERQEDIFTIKEEINKTIAFFRTLLNRIEECTKAKGNL